MTAEQLTRWLVIGGQGWLKLLEELHAGGAGITPDRLAELEGFIARIRKIVEEQKRC